jgi:hypothetical protein
MKKILQSFALTLTIGVLLAWSSIHASAQQHIFPVMSSIEGQDISPDNILNIRILNQGNKTVNVAVKGELRYRQNGINLSYTFMLTLQPGTNTVSPYSVHPEWHFSNAALQDLFLNKRLLPAGTYEYCVTADPVNTSSEVLPGGGEDCIYHTTEDPFLVNLISPDDKAEVHEYNPMLSWIANYSFQSELTYRLRVAEIKKGQNPSAAILRNPSVYDEKNLMVNSQVYPVYAKPLVKDQPYAWTIDAYYKGLLLGSAETWQFVIREDSIINGQPADRSYIDIRKENGASPIYAKGSLKLKFIQEKRHSDSLFIHLLEINGSEIALTQNKLGAVYGDNRYELDLKNGSTLKHAHKYSLVIQTKYGEHFSIPFEYLNPDFK